MLENGVTTHNRMGSVYGVKRKEIPSHDIIFVPFVWAKRHSYTCSFTECPNTPRKAVLWVCDNEHCKKGVFHINYGYLYTEAAVLQCMHDFKPSIFSIF